MPNVNDDREIVHAFLVHLTTHANISLLADQINKWAESKGWNDKPRILEQWLTQINSELSEAFEEYQQGHRVNEVYVSKEEFIEVNGERYYKPLGIPVEMVDALIRILHFFAYNKIDIADVLCQKMEFNARRSYRHGGKTS